MSHDAAAERASLLAGLGIESEPVSGSDDLFGSENLSRGFQAEFYAPPAYNSDGTLVGTSDPRTGRQRGRKPKTSMPSTPVLAAGGAALGALLGALASKDQGKGAAIGILLGGGLPLALGLATGSLRLGG